MLSASHQRLLFFSLGLGPLLFGLWFQGLPGTSATQWLEQLRPKSENQTTICEPARQRQLSLNITDKDDKFVSSLRTEDLALTVDKNPTEILSLETKLDEPLAVVILIDTSMSQEEVFPQTKLAAQKFVEWVFKSKKDRAAVVTFAGEATVEADLTDDPNALRVAIRQIATQRAPDYVVNGTAGRGSPPIQPRRQGTTAMWDAIWASSDEILKPVTNTRRVIFLLTDGSDSSSMSRWRETILHTALNDVAVFAIGINEWNELSLVGRKNLDDLTETTGGRKFLLKKIQDIPGIFAKIEPEIRSRYVISYCATTPPSPDDPPKVHLELKNSQLRESNPRLLYRRYAQ
ncbi:MAG TPA: VWA domain-containing protein [Pyrinomonadaceae bacterium]|nr:VWA domain-containing protein [Pyrinomonadaceae bacterium]